MSTSAGKRITNVSAFFLEPTNSTHRQYEALRAYFVEGLASAEAARRFGYTPGSFRVLCHAFRQSPHREFFRPPQKGPTVAPKRDRVREQVIRLRKQNLSIYDISKALEECGHRLSPGAVSLILKQEGFAR
jgi:transposase-like protein